MQNICNHVVLNKLHLFIKKISPNCLNKNNMFIHSNYKRLQPAWLLLFFPQKK